MNRLSWQQIDGRWLGLSGPARSGIAAGAVAAVTAIGLAVLAAWGALPAVATAAFLMVGATALGVGIVVRRRRAASWDRFEQAFWSYVARQPRSGRRSRRSP